MNPDPCAARWTLTLLLFPFPPFIVVLDFMQNKQLTGEWQEKHYLSWPPLQLTTLAKGMTSKTLLWKNKKRKIKSDYVMQRFANELNFSILLLAIFKFFPDRRKLTENFYFFQTDNPLKNQCWKTSPMLSRNLSQQRIIILQKSPNSTILLNSKLSFYICVPNRCQMYGKKKRFKRKMKRKKLLLWFRQFLYFNIIFYFEITKYLAPCRSSNLKEEKYSNLMNDEVIDKPSVLPQSQIKILH